MVPHINADNDNIYESLWNADGITEMVFLAHGIYSDLYGRYAAIRTEPTSGIISYPSSVSPPYKLSKIVALACGADEMGWKMHLSSKGLFMGFKGFLNPAGIAVSKLEDYMVIETNASP